MNQFGIIEMYFVEHPVCAYHLPNYGHLELQHKQERKLGGGGAWGGRGEREIYIV